ncbi:mitochondrial fission ELM1 family protein [Magnetospira thiophila]
MSRIPTIWALCDDRAGNVNQVRGVAEALGLPFMIQDLTYTAAAALPNYMVGATFGGLTRDARINLAPPWPEVVIAAGRRTAPVARAIKEKAKGKCFLLQIMYPGDAGIDEFDMVAVPHHDKMPHRDNFFEILGAPHRLNAGNLAAAAKAWEGKFDHLPSPRIALIVGGSTKRRDFTPEMGAELGRLASGLAQSKNGSLLVTTSRRTGEATGPLLDAIDCPAFTFRWGDKGDNPYLGYMAVADAVIVTGDSVSMCSEACALPKPTYIYAPKKVTVRKHAMLHQELFAKGYARPLEGALSLDWTHPVLNTADVIAEELLVRMGLR